MFDRDVAIPQICVAGDQSSGKSSVLEAICHVPLPKAARLSTRCHIELRLSNQPHRPVLADDTPPMTVSFGFPTENYWMATVETSCDHNPVTVSKAELGAAIAQCADELVGNNDMQIFSEERVIVKISDSNLPNLILIDLPGYA